jgi:hypothetical protein
MAYRCLRALWVRRRSSLATGSYESSEQRQNLISLLFVLTMFTLGTINFVAQIVSTVQAFVDNRLFPEGATAWSQQTAGNAASQVSNICCIIATFLSDGILVSGDISEPPSTHIVQLWRAFVIWNRSFRVMAVPFILFNAVSGASAVALQR